MPPPLPTPSRTLDLPGFTLGHGTDRDALTGVTVILCPEGALAAAEVRGSATGTRQFDALVSGHHVSSKAHAVVLSGGSAFGLSSADPVVSWLATDAASSGSCARRRKSSATELSTPVTIRAPISQRLSAGTSSQAVPTVSASRNSASRRSKTNDLRLGQLRMSGA